MEGKLKGSIKSIETTGGEGVKIVLYIYTPIRYGVALKPKIPPYHVGDCEIEITQDA